MSQGIEQLVSEDLLSRDNLKTVLNLYVNKIWGSFDYPIFIYALKAAQERNIDDLCQLDELCFVSKISEESRGTTAKMGANLAKAINFEPQMVGKTYRDLIEQQKALGTYPVVLGIISKDLNLNEEGGLSLLYANLIEVIAALVRMASIDYLEAQDLISELIQKIDLKITSLNDIHQSFPVVDIAAMRHENNPSRMFIS